MKDAADLYREYGAALFRYALMILADRADAEDVLQQVFTAILDRSSDLSMADPASYLRTAVRNASYSLLRKRRTRQAAAETMLEPAAWECSPAEQAALEQALRALSPEQREVVHLHVYEGMTFQEIAEATGDSINTVSARYRYALDRMRKTLGHAR